MEREDGNSGYPQTKKQKDEPPGCKDLIKCLVEPPTLQHLSVISFATKLWTERDMAINIEENLKKISRDSSNGDYLRIEHFNMWKTRLHDKLSKVFLPDSLKVKVQKMIVPLGFQIIKYVLFTGKNSRRLQNAALNAALDKWTMTGSIDKAKTTRELIISEACVDDYYSLFILACKYCLEEIIVDLWRIQGPFANFLPRSYMDYSRDLFYWISFVKDEMSNFMEVMIDSSHWYEENLSVCANMLKFSLDMVNIHAVKYFWGKLTHEERRSNLRKWFSDFMSARYSAISFFRNNIERDPLLKFLLLQLGTYNLLEDILQVHSFGIIKMLFRSWPLETVFVSTFKVAIDYLRAEEYVSLMRDITDILDEYSFVEDAFFEIWPLSPLTLKTTFLQDIENSTRTLYELLRCSNFGAIELFLKDASLSDKRNIAINMHPDPPQEFSNFYLFERLIVADKLESFDTLLKYCLILDADVSNLKKQILMDCGHKLFCNLLKSLNFKQTEKLFHWGFQSLEEVQRFKEDKIDKTEVCRILMEKEQYEFADKFMNWYFGTKEKKEEFKRTFISENNSENLRKLLHYFSNDESAKWESFEVFLNFMLPSSVEICYAKKLFLNEVDFVISRRNFEFASMLLDWCLGSSNEVKRFKRNLMVSEKGVEVFNNGLQRFYSIRDLTDSIKSTVKWFYPFSSQEVVQLKSRLNDRIQLHNFNPDIYNSKNQMRALSYILDCYANKYDDENSAANPVDDIVLNKLLNEKYDNPYL